MSEQNDFRSEYEAAKKELSSYARIWEEKLFPLLEGIEEMPNKDFLASRIWMGFLRFEAIFRLLGPKDDAEIDYKFGRAIVIERILMRSPSSFPFLYLVAGNDRALAHILWLSLSVSVLDDELNRRLDGVEYGWGKPIFNYFLKGEIKPLFFQIWANVRAYIRKYRLKPAPSIVTWLKYFRSYPYPGTLLTKELRQDAYGDAIIEIQSVYGKFKERLFLETADDLNAVPFSMVDDFIPCPSGWNERAPRLLKTLILFDRH